MHLIAEKLTYDASTWNTYNHTTRLLIVNAIFCDEEEDDEY